MMYYIESKSNSATVNLALEQYIFDNFNHNDSCFMLWRNANAIIIGKNQNTIEEINQKYVDENNIQVVRRLSGGGAMYQDLGNVNYTFIVNKDSKLFDFAKFCKPIVNALASIGVYTDINGRNDITIDGKKFSGNSQYIKKDRVLHHGTIMFNSNLTVLSQALHVPENKIKSKGFKSIKSRVTNIKSYVSKDMDTNQFFNLIRSYMFKEFNLKEYTLTVKQKRDILQLSTDKYSDWQWNYGYSPKCSIKKEKRFGGCGTISVYLDIEDAKVKDIHIYGDYFSKRDTEELEHLLYGTRYNKTTLVMVLEKIDINEYFYNLKKDEFIKLLTY